MLYTYERLSKFMKEFMIRKVTIRDGYEIYCKNGELYTINEHGEKDYESVKLRYMLNLMDFGNYELQILKNKSAIKKD